MRRPASKHPSSSLSVSPADLENLISALDVKAVALSECLVAAGHRLEMDGLDHSGIHYNVAGNGRMSIRGGRPFELPPHTLIVVPPNSPFWIEVPGDRVKRVRGELRKGEESGVRRFVAGDQEPDIILICGFFAATYGLSTNVFRDLEEPIIERFAIEDRVHSKLENALTELAAQEVGSRAMSDALLKQVIVQLIRRSLDSSAVWAKRFALLRDPQIARAFGAMAASPASAHTVLSLARTASLGRSRFMARFTEVMGETPMTVLRDLRMGRAAHYLSNTDLSIDKIADLVGYASRSSFARVFRHTYRADPSEYRARLREQHSPLQRSITTSSLGREQQTRTFPSAGGSRGSGP
jgi:AraC family transcriptional activator of mtrCDE